MTNPFNLSSAREILTRIYSLLAEYGLRIVGAVLILAVGRWVAIEEHGMTIPFPQRDIYIQTAASAANLKTA